MSAAPSGDRSAELFARVVAGELDSDSPEVISAMEGDPRLRGALEEAVRMREALERTGAEQRTLMDEALEDVRPGDQELVAAFVRERSETRRIRRLWGAVAAAAAVLALSLLVLWPDREEEPGRTGPLDDPPGSGASPQGAVHEILSFELPVEPTNGGWAVVEVFDADAPAGSDPVLKERFEERSWELDAEERGALPRRIRWSYDVWDGTGVRVEGGSFEAELSP